MFGDAQEKLRSTQVGALLIKQHPNAGRKAAGMTCGSLPGNGGLKGRVVPCPLLVRLRQARTPVTESASFYEQPSHYCCGGDADPKLSSAKITRKMKRTVTMGEMFRPSRLT